jgi:hypothetical protein
MKKWFSEYLHLYYDDAPGSGKQARMPASCHHPALA